MDNGTMTREQALYKLAIVIMKNESAEAEAVKGYTEQLAAIDCVRQFAADENDLTEYLNRLEAATSEKIADELSHGKSLYEEYTELTGITPKED